LRCHHGADTCLHANSESFLPLPSTFCALRTSEAFGLPWRNFHYDEKKKTAYFLIDQIAFEGEIFKRTKNAAGEAQVHIGPRTLKAVLA
jgi:hypothetical protein